jgi:hypothetical protein
MYSEQELAAEREADIDYFIRSYSSDLIKKMEFRFFRSGSMWTSMFYMDGYSMENWIHAGEITCEDLGDAVFKCYEMAEARAALLAAQELHRRGVR